MATSNAPNRTRGVYQREKGLPYELRPQPPFNQPPEFFEISPLGKIPVYQDGDFTTPDSSVICAYLDTLHGGQRFIPVAEPAHWQVLRIQAVGDGILDAAVNTRYETFLRPENLRWSDWVDGQMGKVRRSLDELEREALGETVDIGSVSIACALGYLDFRFADEGWRDSRSKLAAWFEMFSTRASMSETRPE